MKSVTDKTDVDIYIIGVSRSVNMLGAFVVSNTVLSEVCQKRLFTSHRCLAGGCQAFKF